MLARSWPVLIVLFLVIGILVFPIGAHAQIVPCRGLDCTVDHLLQIVVNIYNWLIGFAALIAMLFIIFGGVRMLYYSYMEDSASELEAAKFTVRRAVGGFVIIALSYLIVATVLAFLGLNRGGGEWSVGGILTKLGL